MLLFFWYVTISPFFHTGFSALHWAVDGGHIDVVQYILSEGVPVSHMGTCNTLQMSHTGVVYKWVWSGDTRCAQPQQVDDVDSSTVSGWTPLMRVGERV